MNCEENLQMEKENLKINQKNEEINQILYKESQKKMQIKPDKSM